MPRANKLADWLWTTMACLWLGLFPLWQGGTYTSITRAKYEGMLLLTGVSLGLALFTAIYALLRREKLPFLLDWRQAVALALFGWMGLSALLSPYRAALNGSGAHVVWIGALRYEGMATQLCYMALFLLMSLHPVHLKPVMHTTALSLLLFMAVVVGQYMDLNPLGLFPAGRDLCTNYEFQGTMGNIDMISGYLSLVVPMLLAGFLLAKKGGWLWYAAGIAGVAQWCCMEVQSGLIVMLLCAGLTVVLMLLRGDCRPRGLTVLAGILLSVALRTALVMPWLDGGRYLLLDPGRATLLLTLLAALLLAGACLLHRRPGRDLPVKVVALIVAVVLIAGVTIFLLLPLNQAHGGLWEIQQMLLGRAEDSFGSYRVAVWKHALALAGERPLLGAGPDTFYYALGDRLRLLGQELPEIFDNPHNEYLALAANCGFPAMGLYILLLAMTLWRRTQEDWRLLAPTLGYALQGLFSFSICLVSPMWWVLQGMETEEKGFLRR